MSRRSTSRKLSAARRQELQVAAAVAREAVLQLHVDHAIALIRVADGRVAEPRMLDIYLRILGLTGPVAETIGNRVLASLGRTGVAAHAPNADENAGEDDVATDDGSLLRTLRRRLRGRVHDELRHIVELQTGAAQAALLELHVRHAHGFVRMLADTHDITAACEVYTDLVHVPAPLAGVLYILVVNRIAAHQRALWPATTSTQDAPQHAPLPGRQGDRPHRTRRPA